MVQRQHILWFSSNVIDFCKYTLNATHLKQDVTGATKGWEIPQVTADSITPGSVTPGDKRGILDRLSRSSKDGVRFTTL